MASYYVDKTLGDDGNAGTIGAPWKTINKVNTSAFVANDSIFFKMDEVWTETLVPPSSGTVGQPITFGAYGSGAKPLISAGALSYGIRDNTGKGYITIDGLAISSALISGIAHTYYVSTVEQSTPGWTVQNCTLTGCIMQLFGPDTIVQDNICTGPQPSTGSFMGGIFIRGAIAANAIVQRNTVSGFYGRGIWFMRTCVTKYAWENHFVAFDYNAVVDPVMVEISPSATVTLAAMGAGAIHCFTTDPKFVDAAHHDFHLLATSPCINAGVDVGLTSDFDGNPIQ